jgi:NitT/TauT family transport system permease protein
MSVSLAAFALFLIVWILITHYRWVAPIFLPPPQNILSRLVRLGQDGTLFGDIWSSLYRIMVGFILASLASLVVGILMGAYELWDAAVEPFIDFVRYMPVVAFVPLTILWVGTDDVQKFVIVWIGTFFQQSLMIMDSIRRVPVDYISLGRTLGMPERKIILRIVVRAAMPEIWDTLRITLGWSWTWVVLAEMVGADSGLGYRITVAQRYFQTDTAIGYIVVLGLLGLATDQLMRQARRILFNYSQVSA